MTKTNQPLIPFSAMQLRKEVAKLTDDELDNERYTLRFERHFLNMSDDEVADRLNICDAEQQRRAAEGF